ncbi:hypothetical protein ACVNS2_23140 [Paenibacillus caseinilyticus]|uniref:Uncharacterized protein n=1 Tax=Paenibacillus mucilaginosus K02 TaxID=997761 RepID=I0BMG5_9BACL|nr:hypothetical protein [Paenibacillus mucilaginosus]AFH63562.2 hypothetical protein B2K_23185 [Paenibacillus mucilaginosus K02]
MTWAWLGLALLLTGTTADTLWHQAYGFPSDEGIPYPHGISAAGLLLSLFACFRMASRSSGSRRGGWVAGCILLMIGLVGSLWDNLLYHTRGIYGAPIQEIPHTMEAAGGLGWLVLLIVITVLRVTGRSKHRGEDTVSSRRNEQMNRSSSPTAD